MPAHQMTIDAKVIAANMTRLSLVMFAVGFVALPAAAQQLDPSANASRLVAVADSAVSATLGAAPTPPAVPKRANFSGERASRDAQQTADWVVDSNDNSTLPFVIVDKVDAKVFVFDAHGRLTGAAPALLGLTRGDDSVPGIGERKIADIRPDERTTPAGRFVASLSHRANGEEILWVDYENAISMHRVVNSNLKERRLERLASATPLDKRISYGCINVPVKFYEQVLSPIFQKKYGIVYVLPETRSPRVVFASYDVDQRAQMVSQPPLAPTGPAGD
jgi:hypothetical protein